MGSSARKKKEKKKDFQKTKLKVGKTKQKPDNFTDTSFKSKSIVVNQQSLTTTAPAASVQFAHYLSLASSSHSDTQRRDALSYLVSQLSTLSVDEPLPLPAAIILPKILPLTLDGSAAVRSQQLKILRLLPPQDIGDRVESALLYVRAGMTHLATEIRVDSLAILEFLLEVAQEETISCPGGWMKTLSCFISMIGWAVSSASTKWTSTSKASFGKAGQALPRQLQVFAKFLRAGLIGSEFEIKEVNGTTFPLWDKNHYMLPTKSNSFAYLNLFGASREEDGEMYIDREDRQRVFHERFQSDVATGVEKAKKEGGETGRAAAILIKVLKEGLSSYNTTNDTQ